LPSARSASLKEAWRVITLDSDGLRDFSVTADAFWDSFKAFFIVAPMYLYSSADGCAAGPTARSRPTPMFASFALLALLWVAWPWAMVTVSHMLGVQRELCALRDRLQLDDRLRGCSDHSGAAVAPGRPDRGRTWPHC
jgi:hypothetical protein